MKLTIICLLALVCVASASQQLFSVSAPTAFRRCYNSDDGSRDDACSACTPVNALTLNPSTPSSSCKLISSSYTLSDSNKNYNYGLAYSFGTDASLTVSLAPVDPATGALTVSSCKDSKAFVLFNQIIDTPTFPVNLQCTSNDATFTYQWTASKPAVAPKTTTITCPKYVNNTSSTQCSLFDSCADSADSRVYGMSATFSISTSCPTGCNVVAKDACVAQYQQCLVNNTACLCSIRLASCSAVQQCFPSVDFSSVAYATCQASVPATPTPVSSTAAASTGVAASSTATAAPTNSSLIVTNTTVVSSTGPARTNSTATTTTTAPFSSTGRAATTNTTKAGTSASSVSSSTGVSSGALPDVPITSAGTEGPVVAVLIALVVLAIIVYWFKFKNKRQDDRAQLPRARV